MTVYRIQDNFSLSGVHKGQALSLSKGAGGGTEGQIESLTYEAYAPGGTALIIESLTDNRNRTVGEIKHLLSKTGGSLVKTGSVTYLFDRVVGENGFEWVPKMTIETDEETGMKVEELIEQLESHDDVKQVFSNLA